MTSGEKPQKENRKQHITATQAPIVTTDKPTATTTPTAIPTCANTSAALNTVTKCNCEFMHSISDARGRCLNTDK